MVQKAEEIPDWGKLEIQVERPRVLPSREQRLPVVNRFFRRANQRLAPFKPILLDSALVNVRSGDLTLEGDLNTRVTERRTGRGVPLAPIVIYVDNVEEFRGRCDEEGRHTYPLSLSKHRALIDVYHAWKRLISASDSLEVLWDNFNDNVIDKKVWGTFKMASPYLGSSSITEKNGHLEIWCGNTGYGGGVYTVEPVDVSNGRIKVKLYTQYYDICALTILPSTELFYGASYTNGYTLFIWKAGINQLGIYSGRGNTVFEKKRLASDPDIIEVLVDDDTIHFIEEGKEIYSENYKFPSKLCNIRLWGQSWYHMRSGKPWVDDFLFVGG